MLAFAKQVAQASGTLLLNKLHNTRTIQSKATESDLVTDADLASEQLIVQMIQQKYPHHDILAEEGTGDFKLIDKAEHLWVIDPLDGTVNYAHHLPIFAVSIAYLHYGTPKVGVVHVPMLGQMFAAEEGEGATLNENPIQVSNTDALKNAVVATGFSYDKHTNPQDNIENAAAFLKRVRGFRRMGAAAVDLAYTAAGFLDGYWEEKLRPWDIAAGVLLIQEAGGVISDFLGQPLSLRKGHVIASNPLLHEKMRNILAPYAQKYYPPTDNS